MRQHLQVKLNQAFSRLVPPQKVDTSLKKSSPLYTDKDNKLCFFFDNGIDPYPELSGYIYGELYIDKSKNLILSISNPSEKQCFRQDILATGIDNMEIIFLDNRNPQKVKKINKWEKHFTKLSPIITLTLTCKKTTSNFAFCLPCFDIPTYYERV